MTPKQIYTALAVIAGHPCSDGENFIHSHRVTREHLRVIQTRLSTLMTKLNYMRFAHDFPRQFRAEPPERVSRRRRAQAQRAEERLGNQLPGSGARMQNSNGFFDDVLGLSPTPAPAWSVPQVEDRRWVRVELPRSLSPAVNDIPQALEIIEDEAPI